MMSNSNSSITPAFQMSSVNENSSIIIPFFPSTKFNASKSKKIVDRKILPWTDSYFENEPSKVWIFRFNFSNITVVRARPNSILQKVF